MKRASKRKGPTTDALWPTPIPGANYTRRAGKSKVRIGAEPDASEKLPWARVRAELIPAKSKSTKSVVLSQGTETVGVTRPLQSLAVLAMQIYALKCHGCHCGSQMRPRQAGRPSVGAPSDPRYGCAVIAVECDSGLARLHLNKAQSLVGGPNGWGIVPKGDLI